MSTKQQFKVQIFGIPEIEQKVLRRILSLSANRANAYELISDADSAEADIVLFDNSNPRAVEKTKSYEAHNQAARSVAIIKDQSGDAVYSIRRPLTATRTLGVLDQVVHKEFGEERTDTRMVPARPTGQPARSANGSGTAATVNKAAPQPAPAGSAGRFRALVVDDSLPVRKQVGIALRRAGVEADFADNGERALELIAGKNYDIVFLDVIMPGADGYQVCKSIKRGRATKAIPVVMLTGRSSPFDKVKGKLSGCDTYLTKPVSLGEFTQTLNKCLDQPLAFDTAAGIA